MRLPSIGVVVIVGCLAVPGCAGGATPLGSPTGLIRVGSGAAESSIRQIVRTLSGRVYIVSVDDDRFAGSGSFARLRMFRADQTGIPRSFSEVDAAGAPAVFGSGAGRPNMSGGDARIDLAGTIHIAFYRQREGAAVYRTFSTMTDRWGAEETVTSLPGAAGNDAIGLRGKVVDALTLDAQGTPVVAVTSPSWVKVFRRGGPGRWSPTTLEQFSSYHPTWHPSLVTDRAGKLHLAWEENDGAESIRYAQRAASGPWGSPETVAAGDVLGDSNNGVIDQGPSIAVDRGDNPVVLYLTGNDHFVRLRVRQTGGWSADDPDPNVFAHTPGLYLNGDDRYVLLGHDANIHPAYLTRTADAGTWSDVAAFAPPGNPSSYAYDGSGSARFDPLFEPDCSVVDAVFFDEDSDTRGGFRPDLYYVAIRLAGAASGGAGCRTIVRRSGVAPAGLSKVHITRSVFRAGDRAARFSYTLSAQAKVAITIQRLEPGRRQGSSCVSRSRAGRSCTRFVAKGRLRSSGRRGANTTAFAGRVGGRALATGRYRALLVATDAAGNHSRTAILAFRIR